jgi:hypothetical protein
MTIDAIVMRLSVKEKSVGALREESIAQKDVNAHIRIAKI